MILKDKTKQANILLFLTAMLWGGGFVAQRLGAQQLGPYLFNGFRFLIGAFTLVPIMALNGKRSERSAAPWGKTILTGIAAGSFLFFGATFQQLGLIHTSAGKAGFITGLYVIIVPLLGMIWRDRAGINTWIGAIFAVIGLNLLSMTSGLKLAPGDGMVLLGAFFWAGHVQFIAKFSPRVDAIRLSFVQALFTALLSFVVGFATEPLNLNAVRNALWPMLYGGVISIGIAHTLQVVGQQSAKPTPAAIILSLESVFAALWGRLFLGELLSPRGLVGSVMMLAGMMISQAKFSRKQANQKIRLGDQ